MSSFAALIPGSGWGEGDEFSPLFHEHRMGLMHYQDWWGKLSDIQRATYEQQIRDFDENEKAREKLRAVEAAESSARVHRESLISRRIPLKDVDLICGGDLVETDAMRCAREFAKSASGILVLSGGRGCGKTTAMSWLCAELGGLFLDVSRLARVSRYSDEQMSLLEERCFLGIDDLGMEFSDEKGSFMATLDGLINARYSNLRPTCVTTNVNAQMFKTRYGERVADRIRECGRFVEISGESMRKR